MTRIDPDKLADLEKRMGLTTTGTINERLEALGPKLEAAAWRASLPSCHWRDGVGCPAWTTWRSSPGLLALLCTTCDREAPMEPEVEAEWEVGAPPAPPTTTDARGATAGARGERR